MYNLSLSDNEFKMLLKYASAYGDRKMLNFFRNTINRPDLSTLQRRYCYDYFWHLGTNRYSRNKSDKTNVLTTLKQYLLSDKCPHDEVYIVYNIIVSCHPSAEYLKQLVKELPQKTIDLLRKK